MELKRPVKPLYINTLPFLFPHSMFYISLRCEYVNRYRAYLMTYQYHSSLTIIFLFKSVWRFLFVTNSSPIPNLEHEGLSCNHSGCYLQGIIFIWVSLFSLVHFPLSLVKTFCPFNPEPSSYLDATIVGAFTLNHFHDLL